MELPAVAKNIFIPCKKCDAERYHKVLAHTGPESAKVQCEVCGSKKTYKLPKEKKPGSTTPRISKKADSPEVRQTKHMEEYNTFKEKCGQKPPLAYSMKNKFTLEQGIEHTKFGVGFVKAVIGDKIEVIFADETRQLVHNRM